MDVICIDSTFSSEVLQFYEKHGVVTPMKDSLYTIRDVIINSNGKTGLLLEEIVNPKIPINHDLMQSVVMFEPNWDINRFRNLDNSAINVSEVKQTIKNYAND